MISANELRIGNYLLADGNIRQVTGMGYVPDDVNYQVMFNNGTEEDWTYDYEPIPLTPKILTDWCGFEDKGIFTNKVSLPSKPPGDFDGAILFEKPDYGQRIYLDDNRFYFELAGCIDDYSDNYYSVEIESVHQLQNLFFALTGKELEINPK